VLQDLEEEQFGGGELFWQPLKNFGLESLQQFCDSIPYGVQSGLKKNFRGIFFYYKYADDNHLWYLYDLSTGEIINNKTTIMKYISCPEKEPRIIPLDIDEFEIHEKIREQIKTFFSESLITSKIRTSAGRMEKSLRDLRDELDYIKTDVLDKDDFAYKKIDIIISYLQSIPWTKKRMQIIRRIWKNYKENNNWSDLLTQLDKFLKDKSIIETESWEEFDESKLKLICVQFIS